MTTTEQATEKITPTPAAINRLAAELIGYRVERYQTKYLQSITHYLYDPQGNYISAHKSEQDAWDELDFCSPDCPHSLTAQLLAKVKDADKISEWVVHLSGDLGWLWEGIVEGVWDCVVASPLLQTVACLKALSAWPDAWKWENPTE